MPRRPPRWPARWGGSARAEEVGDADLVVNATSVGMGTEGDLPLDAERLGSGQLVVDLVYHPATTPLCWPRPGHAARSRSTASGMLIHQAAHAFRLWTGEDPPVEVMSAAATAELAGRGAGGPIGP